MLKNICFSLKWKFLAAIIVLLSAVAFCFWWFGRAKGVDALAQDVANVAAEIRRNYAHKNSYWGLDTNSLNGIKTLRRKENQIINCLNKPILVGQGENADVIMPGERTFDIIFTNLSKKECVRAATSIFESPETLGLLQVTIIGKENQVFEWGAAQYNLPISPTRAEEFCADNSKIIWTFE